MYELSNNYQSGKSISKKNKRKDFFTKNFKNKLIFIIKILAIVLISTLLMIIAFQFESISSSETNLIEVKIVEGDNLWKIADRYYGENIDLRKKIFQIKKINELETAMLKPGQKIVIPINK